MGHEPHPLRIVRAGKGDDEIGAGFRGHARVRGVVALELREAHFAEGKGERVAFGELPFPAGLGRERRNGAQEGLERYHRRDLAVDVGG